MFRHAILYCSVIAWVLKENQPPTRKVLKYFLIRQTAVAPSDQGRGGGREGKRGRGEEGERRRGGDMHASTGQSGGEVRSSVIDFSLCQCSSSTVRERSIPHPFSPSSPPPPPLLPPPHCTNLKCSFNEGLEKEACSPFLPFSVLPGIPGHPSCGPIQSVRSSGDERETPV